MKKKEAVLISYQANHPPEPAHAHHPEPPRGFALSFDAFLAVLLVSGAIVFFISQPFFDTPFVRNAIQAEQNLSDVFDTLENSGFLSKKLVNRVFDDKSVEEIYLEAKKLVGENTQFRVRVTEFIPAENLDSCKNTFNFAECFPDDATHRRTFEYPALSELSLPDTGYVRDKKILAKHRPFPELEGNESQCVTNLELKQLENAFRLQFQQDLPLDLEFQTRINPTQTECDSAVDVNIYVRNEARDPVAVMLVMDKSGSMSQMDMVYQETDSTVSGQFCQRQVEDRSVYDHNANNFNVTQRSGYQREQIGAYFDGTAHLETPHDDALVTPDGAVSISLWVNVSDLSGCGTGSTPQCVMTSKYGYTYWSLAVNQDGRVVVGMSGARYVSNFVLTPSNWAHLVVTYGPEGGQYPIRVYKDGFSSGILGYRALSTVTHPFRVGGSSTNQTTTTNYFKGTLDEVRVYNRVLSQNEVNGINSGKSTPTDGLILYYDFEDLSLDPKDECFYTPAQPITYINNCGSLGSANLFPQTGGIDPVYTDFNTIASFTVSKSYYQYLQDIRATLRVNLDRGGPSSVCSLVTANNTNEPPFVRVQKPDDSYFVYSGAATAYNRYNQQLQIGAHTVEIWNHDSENYIRDNNVFAEAVGSTYFTAQPIAATGFESEGVGPVEIAAVQLAQTGVECGQYTENNWQQIGTYTATNSQLYYLDFNIAYIKTQGACGPHLRVDMPTGETLSNINCPNTKASCGIVAHSGNRTGGPYAPTGVYTVYAKSDSTIDVSVQTYHARYLPNAYGLSTDDPRRRCEYEDDWRPVGSFQVLPTQNLYSAYARVNYSFTSPYCRPQMRVLTPGDTYAENLNCDPDRAYCITYIANNSYYGPYAQAGEYAVEMRLPVAVTPSNSYLYLVDFWQQLYHIGGQSTDPDFVGGGTCSGETCQYTTRPASPARTNCPNRNVSYSDGTDFSLSRGIEPLGSLAVTAQDSIRRISAQVNATMGDAACLGGAVGFENPVSGSSDQSVYFPFPTEWSGANMTYGINVSSATNNVDTTIPIPSGTYTINGWSDLDAQYETDWFLERIDYAKIASRTFLDNIGWQERDRLGLVEFSSTTTTSVPLTNNVEDLRNGINALVPDGETAIGDALQAAIDELDMSDIDAKFIILLTDGQDTDGVPVPEQVALQAQQKGIIIYTIGFGENVNDTQLEAIATLANGQYLPAENAQELAQAFEFLFVEIQQTFGLSNVNLVIPKGIDVANIYCENTQKEPCVGTDADPTCKCGSIVVSSPPDSDGQLTFRDSRIQAIAPEWWQASFKLTVRCNGPLCTEQQIQIPVVGSNVTNTDGTPRVEWNPQGTALLTLKPKDLALSVSGEIDDDSALSDLEIQLTNNSALDVTLAGRTQGDCTDGIQIHVHNDNTDEEIVLCTSAAGLCGNATCETGFSYAQSFETYDLLDFPLGYTTISIDPLGQAEPVVSAVTGEPAPIFECTANNEIRLACFKNPETGYYLVEYWSWRT